MQSRDTAYRHVHPVHGVPGATPEAWNPHRTDLPEMILGIVPSRPGLPARAPVFSTVATQSPQAMGTGYTQCQQNSGICSPNVHRSDSTMTCELRMSAPRNAKDQHLSEQTPDRKSTRL